MKILKTSLILVAALVTPLDGFNFPNPFITNVPSNTSQTKVATELEDELIKSIQKRLSNDNEVNDLVQKLESVQSISEPAIAPEVYGRWKLLATTNVNTSSPIQRTAVDAQKYKIYQDINVVKDEKLVVSQVVEFGVAGNKLCVDALASTSAYPLDELTERKGSGKILGLNILGVSMVGDEAKEDINRPNSRIKFVFDEGNFDFGGVKVPYPVPFRLPVLRDAVKGWIDITYMSKRLRISRGNKGTTFILIKQNDE